MARYESLANPKVIVGVLSPGTADYDRGGKFHYRRRSPNDWDLQIATGLDVVRIASLGIEISLGTLYQGILEV